MHLPPRHGDLFNPARFPFLEGRPADGARQIHERIDPPLVHDGTVYRALDKLLVLDGERISYRALDVEQIGSVYETMMGFRLEAAHGRSASRPGGETSRCAGYRQPGRAAGRAVRVASEVAPGAYRPEADRSGEAFGPGGGYGGAVARGTRCGPRSASDARPGPDRGDGAPAERGAAPLRLALHAA